MIPLLTLLASIGITLGGLTPAQLAPINVRLTNAPLIIPATATNGQGGRAAALACAADQPPPCVADPGPTIIIDYTYLPAPFNVYLDYALMHEAYNLVYDAHDDAASFSRPCDQFPVPECSGIWGPAGANINPATVAGR